MRASSKASLNATVTLLLRMENDTACIPCFFQAVPVVLVMRIRWNAIKFVAELQKSDQGLKGVLSRCCWLGTGFVGALY